MRTSPCGSLNAPIVASRRAMLLPAVAGSVPGEGVISKFDARRNTPEGDSLGRISGRGPAWPADRWHGLDRGRDAGTRAFESPADTGRAGGVRPRLRHYDRQSPDHSDR